ncbi:unnamed protein product [Phytomonas sp. EM1]|nr:unnamed protein product [Phytomonas sp. EM1]|eukprot:CCW63159.1 unnamed protein product [Phytomonas sp. isolate EM1]
MDLLPKYLNELQDGNKARRIEAYRMLKHFASACREQLSLTEGFDIIRGCLRGFEDGSERCREEAVLIVLSLLEGQTASVLDWVLPVVVTRIGVSPVVETSEEVRLLLLRLAALCLSEFPHEIVRGNFIDFFQVLLENCLLDPFPELKKEACEVIKTLCSLEPQRVQAISPALARRVKLTCVMHKHSAVRCAAVGVLAVLIQHGAAEILGEEKDEPENQTTATLLFVLANDHSEAVRYGVLSVLSCALLDIKERLDQHRTYLPHLLLLSSDPFERVRVEACEILEKVGKLYMFDNEDNRIDLAKRRINAKDIEWYADDEYQGTGLDEEILERYPILRQRPPLGTRCAIAEASRNFLQKILADIGSIDWVIPYSTNNRKTVALRILWNVIFHCEKSIVQVCDRILSSLYKVMRDDNEEVRKEALLCVEMVSRFLTPSQYLPFLIAKPKQEEDETFITVEKTRTKTVILSETGETKEQMPTLFSTAATTTKCSILIALGYFLKSSESHLTATDATLIVQVITSKDIIECENEDMLLSLLSTMLILFGVYSRRGFISSPSRPLPEEIKNDPQQRTLDSVLLYALLRLKCYTFPKVVSQTSHCIEELSNLVTGTPLGIYSLHLHRLLLRYAASFPVAALADLLLHADLDSRVGQQLREIFYARLGAVDFTLRITDELRLFVVLERLLWDRRGVFSAEDLEALLRSVVLPLATFHPGNVAHLFRKVAVNCICAYAQKEYRELLAEKLSEDESSLGSKVALQWASASDGDDGEMRLACMTTFAEVCKLPMSEGCANELVQSLLIRFDDGSEVVRLRSATALREVMLCEKEVSPRIIKEIEAQIVPLARKILIYLDDIDENIGIRPVLEEVLKLLGDVSPHIVVDLTTIAMEKHHDRLPCQRIINHIKDKYTNNNV